MNISFPNNYLTSERQNQIQNLKKVTETDSGRKQVPSNNISTEAGVDKEESDRLLRKVQFAQTKAEVLGHYLGAMQNAVRDSGSNGVVMLRRTGHLMATQKAFQETDQYKKKKEQDTFILDQMEVLEKRQEEMEELKEAQKENQEEAAYSSREDSRQSAVKDGSDSSARESQQKRSVSNAQNVDLQKKAANSFKTKDAPARNPSVQGVFSGMI